MSMIFPCPFFGRCGGCLYQDLPHEVYLEKKRQFIRRSFSDKGINLTLDDFIEVPLETRRRAGFKFSNGKIGFNEHKGHRLIDIDTCLLLTSGLNALLPAFRELIRQIGGSGELFVLETPMGVDVHILLPHKKADLSLWEKISLWAGQVPSVVRVLLNHTPVLEKAPLPVPSAESFLQPSVYGEETLIRHVLQASKGYKTAIDLFCGAGTFLKPLLNAGLKAIGYDIAGDSLKTLGKNAVARDLFRNPLSVEELNDIDFVVMDPPRAGAQLQTNELANATVQKIIMISCNPITAARDTAILLKNGKKLISAVGLDQFNYSNHVELILTFS